MAVTDPSLTGKRWLLQEENVVDADPAEIIRRLFTHRRLSSATDTSCWYDPSIYTDSSKAAQRVWSALRCGERIGLFGDYDCDGITSCAQMVRFFRRHGHEPVVRLPHRMRDGYGIKPSHIDEFHSAGVRLLITVDTGISAYDAVKNAQALGIDVIILDHHAIASQEGQTGTHFLLPPAFAILHPLLARPAADLPPTCAHPSAAGVVFSFLHALYDGELWEDRDTDLALAMIGTIADVVALREGNRQLVQEGLLALQRLPEGPLRTLADSVSKGALLTSIDIAFRIAPRINAAGRMDDPLFALRALLEGGEHLQELEIFNQERQRETVRCVEHALSRVDMDAPFLCAMSKDYPSGIVGLVAGRLMEQFGRPSLAACIQGETCVASLRSPPCYNIVEGLRRAQHLLMSFGGHAQAAGCHFSLANAQALNVFLRQDVALHVPSESLCSTLTIDAAVHPRALTTDFCRALSALQPYGQGNPEPLFLLKRTLLKNIRLVGRERQHLQAVAGPCKLIGFHLGHLATHAGEPLDLVCRLGIDTWNGRETPQLFLQDARVPLLTPEPISLPCRIPG